MNISNIKPYPKNAKKHPKKQIEQVANSIKEFGFNQPIVLDKDNVVIVGHGRLEAAKLLGLKDVPTITLDLTKERANAYRLADNKLNESEWDMGLVIEELKELSAEMLDLTGFDKDLIIEPGEKDDIVPHNVPTVSNVGDLYELGPHRVLCGDSTQREAVLALFGDKKADMIFTDPPYGVAYVGKTKKALTIKNDALGDEGTRLLVAQALQMAEVKRGGAFYLCSPAGNTETYFRLAVQDAGFLLKQCLVWNKSHFVLGRQDYQWKHESILYGWVDGASHSFYGGRNLPTVWDIDRPTQSKEHPTMKPIDLVSTAIINSSKEEDIVYDAFLGSGSTVIACEKTGRVCFGLELDTRYVDVIVQRYCDYVGNYDIIKNGKSFVWPTSKGSKS